MSVFAQSHGLVVFPSTPSNSADSSRECVKDNIHASYAQSVRIIVCLMHIRIILFKCYEYMHFYI